jgi:hypothetical protein
MELLCLAKMRGAPWGTRSTIGQALFLSPRKCHPGSRHAAARHQESTKMRADEIILGSIE